MGRRTDADGGDVDLAGDAGGERLGHPFDNDREGAGIGDGLCVSLDGGPFAFLATSCLKPPMT